MCNLLLDVEVWGLQCPAGSQGTELCSRIMGKNQAPWPGQGFLIDEKLVSEALNQLN